MAGLPSANGESTYGEPSWDRTTPFTTGGDIPIDPALSEPPLDPVLMEEDGVSGDMEVSAFWLRIKMCLVHDAEVAERVASRSCLHTQRVEAQSLTFCRDRHNNHLRSTIPSILHASNFTFKDPKATLSRSLSLFTFQYKRRSPHTRNRSRRGNAHPRANLLVNTVRATRATRMGTQSR